MREAKKLSKEEFVREVNERLFSEEFERIQAEGKF